MPISPQRVVVRIGMSAQVPPMQIGEAGWDVDKRRLRIGDGTTTPTILMTDKSIGVFEYKFISYVLYPQINMLPEGTVDGVDISDLNQANGLITRRGDNLWAARAIVTTDSDHISIVNGNGVVGNPTVNFSDAFKSEIQQFLKTVAVDDITIHGNGTPAAPLNAQLSDTEHRGVVELATNDETIQGVDNSRAITPAGLSSRTATNDRNGIVQLATLTETIAGNDNSKAVTPYDLQNKKADTVNYGIVRFATDGEMENGAAGVVASAQSVKTYVEKHGSGNFTINIMSNEGATTGNTNGMSNYKGYKNFADFTWPVYLEFQPEQKGRVLAVSGTTPGGSPNGTGGDPTSTLYGDMMVLYNLQNSQVNANFNHLPYTCFTCYNGIMYGVDGYKHEAIVGTGNGKIFFSAFSAGGMNVLRYTRSPINFG